MQINRLRTDLRFCSTDALFSSLMIGAGESLLIPFALALGFADSMVGILASFPFLIAASIQLFSPVMIQKLGSYRTFCLLCGVLQSLCFIPLSVLAYTGYLSVPLLFFLATLYWSFGLATGPAWNSWVGLLIPTHLRAKYFAMRNRVGQMGILVGLMGSGLILQAFKANGMELKAFALLFLFAGVARTVSAYCLWKQSEPEGAARNEKKVRAKELVYKTRSEGDGRLFMFMMAFQAAVHFSAPFFTPFMLKHLNLPYTTFMGLTAISLASKAFFFPLVGRWCQRHGSLKMMRVGLIMVSILPAMWIVSPNIIWLAVAEVMTGFAWATFDLGYTMTTYQAVDDRERTSFLSQMNFCNALAMFAGSYAGSQILAFSLGSKSTYLWIFALSTIARFATYGLSRRITARKPERVENAKPAKEAIVLTPSAS